MSTHPNVLLILKLTPDNLTRKTYRDILTDNDAEDDIAIGDTEYHCKVMEDDYDDSYQISANEGDIIVFDLVTYGYGESITFDELTKKKDELEAWAKITCKKHNCSYGISVSANYW
jgi:hypothetical protein